MTAFSFLNFSHIAKGERKSITQATVHEMKNLTEKPETPKVVDKIDKSQTEKIILLTLIFFLSFICYGLLPGLQSYSTLPYSNQVYNLAVKLSTKQMSVNFKQNSKNIKI